MRTDRTIAGVLAPEDHAMTDHPISPCRCGQERHREQMLALGRGLWLKFARWQAGRQLHALNDRSLKDIGLHRSAIEHAVINGICAKRCRRRKRLVKSPRRRKWIAAHG